MLDRVRIEVIRNALRLAAEEMGTAVVRASFSSIIQEMAEASACVLTADGRLVHGPQPIHSSSLRLGLRAIVEDFPLDTMVEGDVYVTNDPYRGGIHANDLLVIKPVFVGVRPAYFTATLVHVADLGGASAGGLPANVTDFYGEGLLLPPVKLYDAGEPCTPVFRILEHNTRLPKNLLGDVQALVSGANVGAMRIAEVLDRFGADAVAEAVDAVLAHSEALAADAVARIPAGTWRGEFHIDDDGSGSGKEYVVRVALSARDGRLALDFDGTSPQADGIINAAVSQVYAAIVGALRACLGAEFPIDEGAYRCLDVTLPEGTLVNPRKPAACNGRVVTANATFEAIVQALAQATPELAMAASGIVHIFTLGGVDATGTQWGYLSVEMGGAGARVGLDGLDGASLPMGMGRVSGDVEPLEARYPILVERNGLFADSGGPGRWRGGVGTETFVRLLAPARVTVRTDRLRLPPPGLDGGAPGRPGGYEIHRAARADAPAHVEQLPGKAMNIALGEGDVLVMRTTGGGGVGDPRDRDPALLADDLRRGVVTSAAAAVDYPGVAPRAGDPA